MRRLALLSFLVLSLVACSGGAGSGGRTGSSSGGSTGEQYGQYDTLTGTFSAPGVSATFSGAVVREYSQGLTEWNISGSFPGTVSSIPSVTVTEPADGGNDRPEVDFYVNGLDAAPDAGTFSCGMTGSMTTSATFVFNSITWYGPPYGGGSCSVTIQSPTEIESETDGQGDSIAYYFAHGSLSGTLVATLSDGGVSDGNISATW